jgi:O-antigen/teichoic acid export membrane protein
MYRAIGRPDLNVKLMMIAVLYFIPLYVLAAPRGLLVFCSVRLALGIFSLPLHFYVAHRLLGVPFTYVKTLVKVPIVATLLMSVLAYGSIVVLNPFTGLLGWIKLGFVLGLAVGSYVLTGWLLDRDYTIRTFKLVKDAVI